MDSRQGMAEGGLDDGASSGRVRTVGLLAGPALAALVLAFDPPAELPRQGWAVLAVAILMAVWWMTEAVPLAVTALMPLILFPLLGIDALDAVAPSYGHPLIFLFLGGFIIARAMERWQLHRRLALHVLRASGGAPAGIVAGVMAVTAFLSMWISNTATAMVMLPIGLSVAMTLRNTCPGASDRELEHYSAALMLGIAYAATIGGMGTLIGTPPNALFAGLMRQSYGVEIGFGQWMLIGVPTVAVLLPVAWLMLTRLVFRIPFSGHGRAREVLSGQLARLEPMSSGEKRVAAIMGLTALSWIGRPFLDRVVPGSGVSDAGIALTAAALLFVVRDRFGRGGEPLIGWREAARINWGVLILFGGGLALAASIDRTGLAAWIGGAAQLLEVLPWFVLLLAVGLAIVYLSELASNTAMAAIFLPIAGAAAIGMGKDPLLLTLPVALAASLGFMLPVATPPNAIVFASGAVTVRQMLRAGALLNIVATVVVVALASLLGPLVF